MASTQRLAITLAVVVFGGCPRGGGGGPKAVPLAPWEAALETAAPAGFHAIAMDDARALASFDADAAAALAGTELAPPTGAHGVVALASGAPAWARVLPARTGAVALAGDLAAVAVAAEGTLEVGDRSVAVRGTPGAAIVGLAAADGSDRWVQPVGATGWSVVRALAGLPGGDVAAVGSFNGTLRVGDAVVTAGGSSDGFIARLGPDGAVRWLVRIGGDYADAITAVAPAGDGVVVGGTFTNVADARGTPLEPIDPEVIAPDGFVARLAADGAVEWARPFGGSSDDAVAGVAVNRAGVVGVAATIRDEVLIEGRSVTARGLSDAVLITFDGKGARRTVAVVGGADYDAAAGIAALGDDFVLAVTYSGTVVVGDTHLSADGGDGTLIAVLAPSGEPRRVHDVAGPGRETVAGLAATPSGWAASIRHTAGATLSNATFPAPADPYAGAALVARPD